MAKYKIIFMGTPELSVPFLEGLINADMKPIAVITQPDRPVGRKQIIEQTPVKKAALRSSIPVLQPENVNATESIEALRVLKPDLIVVIAFGQIISKAILDIPSLGCVNVHPSLLPLHRGAIPLQGAIMNGDTTTGITIMLMDEKMDHGPILKQTMFSLSTNETLPSLQKKAVDVGVPLLINTLQQWTDKKISPKEQDHTLATYTRLLKKDSGKIDWSKSAIEIDRMVRALNPWPGTWTQWNEKLIKILRAHVIENNALKKMDDLFLFNDDRSILAIPCAVEVLAIDELQIEGKNPQTGKDFIHGHLAHSRPSADEN